MGITITNLTRTSGEVSEANAYILALFLAFMSMVGRASSQIANRHINTHIHSVFFPFWFSMGMFISAVTCFTFSYGGGFNFINLEYFTVGDILLFGISGLSNYAAITTESLAFKYENASFLAPTTFFQSTLLLV
jgi:hypothetical protein